MMPADFTEIAEPNLKGYEARRGARRVELIRCYAGQWAVFAYEDGQMIRSNSYQSRDYPFNRALSIANELLKANS